VSRFWPCVLVCWLALAPFVAVAADSLVIPGTGDSQQLLQMLANEFMAVHPETVVEIPQSIGSTGGIRSVLSGQAELSRVARPLSADEIRAGLNHLVFAYSPVVFAAHLESPCVRNLSRKQAVDIYSGAIGDWALLGDCPSQVIYVARRERGDSSRTVIEANVPEFLATADPAGEIVYSTPETVQILLNYPNTIAYVPLATLVRSSLNVLNFDGIAPTAENVQTGRYPLVVPLGLVWKEQLSPPAEKFVDYLFSPAAQALMRDQALVPARHRN